jgi:hypothetical protein
VTVDYEKPKYSQSQLDDFRKQAARNRVNREKCWRAHLQYIGDGKTLEESQVICMERFELTERQFKNVLDRRSNYVDAATAATAEVMLQKNLAKFADDLVVAYHEAQDELSIIDEAETAGEQWYDIEQVETTGGKFGNTVATKRVSLPQARAMIRERITKDRERFIKSITDMMPKSQVNLFLGKGVDQIPDDELDKQLAAGKTGRRDQMTITIQGEKQ